MVLRLGGCPTFHANVVQDRPPICRNDEAGHGRPDDPEVLDLAGGVTGLAVRDGAPFRERLHGGRMPVMGDSQVHHRCRPGETNLGLAPEREARDAGEVDDLRLVLAPDFERETRDFPHAWPGASTFAPKVHSRHSIGDQPDLITPPHRALDRSLNPPGVDPVHDRTAAALKYVIDGSGRPT